MLAVLAEINCLNTLRSRGIYPDYFYTDFELFKNHVVNYKDASVIVIFAGVCSFNKRIVVDFVKNLMKRMNNSKDSGINNIVVLSDNTLGTLDTYYKYQGHFDKFDLYKRYNCMKQDTDILLQLEGKKVETKLFLSRYDSEQSEYAREAYKKKYSSEDELVKYIKRPNVKELLQQASN